MSVIFTILICIFSIGVFILYAYFKYGTRRTFNFFFFAFFIASLKEGPMCINGIWTKNPAMPYEFLKGHSSVIANTFLAMFGWIFTFCLGWYIADRISQRLGSGKGHIFAVLLLIGLVTASIGYAVEATAIGIGWWRWTIVDMRMVRFLVGVPFISIITWMHFPTQYLFAPYFLINCSKFRKASWKGVFFLIPFLHSLTADFRPEIVRVSVEYTALIAMVILALTNSLRFDCAEAKLPSLPRFLKPKWLELLPMLIVFLLLFILVFFDLAKAKDAKLLISLLPLLFLILLAIKKIPLVVMVLLAFMCWLLFKELALLAVIPVIILILLKILIRNNDYFCRNNLGKI
jgi:hypothetical protein